MKCLKTEAAFLAGIGVFLVGTACLIAVEVHNIYPAREEQKFEEINCTLESCNMDASAKCSKHKHDNKEFSCLRVYVVCGSKAESNDSNMLLQTAHKRRLLTRNYHSLHKQCTYEPEECREKQEAEHKLLKSAECGNPTRESLTCYYNPKDPDEILHQKASTESYNRLVLQNMAWATGIVVLGLAVVIATGCFISSYHRRYSYQRIDDNSIL